eukprot:g18457.t1
MHSIKPKLVHLKAFHITLTQIFRQNQRFPFIPYPNTPKLFARIKAFHLPLTQIGLSLARHIGFSFILYSGTRPNA